MAVRPQELDTPEDGLVLETRSPAPPPAGAAEALAALRERLQEALELRAPEVCSCRDCWEAGCKAVVATVKLGDPHDDPAAELARMYEQLELARALSPRGLHWRARWEEGRDAAIAVIEGLR